MFSNLENRESILGTKRGYLNISTFEICTAQKTGDFILTQLLVSPVTLRMLGTLLCLICPVTNGSSHAYFDVYGKNINDGKMLQKRTNAIQICEV